MYARHLCEKAGVKFVLGKPHGELEQLITEQSGSSKKVTGIRTRDGQSHSADLVVVACECLYLGVKDPMLMSVGGPWTAHVVPEAHRSVEATMGTLMFIDIPEHRKDIREKFHPKNMPIWRFLRGEGDGYASVHIYQSYLTVL